MSKQLENVRHDYIRYANCWEDADVLLEGLQVQPGNRVLSIGSAGDNSFSLLCADPKLVVAVDINVVQLNLIELKKAAIATLAHKEYLQFIGFAECQNRSPLFEKVKASLTPDLCNYWQNRWDDIAQGIVHQGKFERYFKLFSKKILPLIHTKRRIDFLFQSKSEDAQAHFYRKHWNNWRWRFLFRLFFSKFVMGRFGRDPAFLKEVEVPVSEFILDQSRKHLSSTYCQNNYFLHFILTGDFGKGLPHYARKENYEVIKQRISRLEICEGLAEQAFDRYGKFDRFNLSNIFEYMNPQIFTEVAESFAANCDSGARLAYWNLMVPRLMHEALPNWFKGHTQLSQKLTEMDKGFFYMSLNLDERL